MDTAAIKRLVDLIVDLDRPGVQELIPDGHRLWFRPRSALTPDLLERLKSHKAELLGPLRPAEGPGGVNRALADGTARWPTRP
jgi:hypothetical protein